jgi:undecaprenyl diphosphate synthase
LSAEPARVIPLHIGFIMDGNGRWAKKRALPRKLGHREGAKTFKKIVEDCNDLGLQYITFYAFSTENKNRPSDEVDALVKLFDEYLDDIRKINDKNSRLRFIGDLSFFPEETRKKMQNAENATKNNTGMTCSLALNYGGRSEILRAVNKIIAEEKSVSALDEKAFAEYLYTAGMPDADLIIRTGGERRISNFLLWQAAYAEYVFTDVLWPDFGRKDLEDALAQFAERARRFGNI